MSSACLHVLWTVNANLRDELLQALTSAHRHHRIPEDEIDTRVSEIRARLLSTMPRAAPPASTSWATKAQMRNTARDSHALAAAKADEMGRMGRALGIGASHVEGGAFSRRDAEVERVERAAKREAMDKERAEAAAKRAAVSAGIRPST